MRARRLASTVTASSIAMLLALVAVHSQSNATPTSPSATTTTTSEYGTLLKLQLKASKLKAVTVAQIPSSTVTGSGQCPAVGTPSFNFDVTQETIPINDSTQFFDGIHAAPVLAIDHLRVTSTATANGNQLVQRQDWTRIKENDNGIDNATGVRHYVGNFLEETQIPNGGSATVTAESQGVMTLLEPLSFSSGPLVGIATRVNVVQFIGPQAAWLEPFQVQDQRVCAFLADGTPRPVDPFYNDHCVVNSNQTISYNGVTFTGNIVGCAQTKWP